jgi:superoxide dismutase, Cu-Zn family
MNLRSAPRLLVLLSVFTGLVAAPSLTAADTHHSAHGKPQAPVGSSAIAVLVPGGNSGVSGTIKFTQEKAGVRVQADVRGLTPGLHGFHVHEKGDLSTPDLTSAGGHFNPTGHPHAGRDAKERHIGDLGNLEAGADGRAVADFVDPKLQLAGPHSIVGRAVIVHEKADDLHSQPTGDAGGRVAGGVIGIVELKKDK